MKKINRLLRYDWPLHVMLMLTNGLPDNVLCLRLRGFLVRPFLAQCGCDFRLGRNVTLYNPTNIYIGSNVYIAYGCWFMASEQVTIGDEVLFGPYCVVVTSNHTRHDGSFRYGMSIREPIIIEKGVWLASHVTVTAGSIIGKGTLVAAQSVVSGKLPANVLAGGQPSKVIKSYE